MTRLAQNEGIIPWVSWVWVQGYVPVKHVLNSCVLHDLLMREAYHKAGKAYAYFIIAINIDARNDLISHD